MANRGINLGSLNISDSNLPKDYGGSQKGGNQDQSDEETLVYAVLDYVSTSEGRDQFVQDISDQLLLKKSTNWGEMLGSAPRALCFVGHCLIAGMTSGEVSTLKLPENYGLKSLTLRANLAECSDLGRLAFLEAHKKMNEIASKSYRIAGPNGTIQQILEDLDDEELAKYDLDLQLKDLKESTRACSEATVSVNEKFGAWEKFASKIFLACTAAGDNAVVTSEDLKNKVAVTAFQEELQEGEIARGKEEIERLKDVAKVSKDLLDKQAKALPTGWNAIAQESVGTFVDTVANVANVASKLPELPMALKFLKFYRKSIPDSDGPPSPQLANSDIDYGLELAGRMAKPLQDLRNCLTRGDPASSGVDLKRLFGDFDRSGGQKSSQPAQIVVIVDALQVSKADAFSEMSNPNASETSKDAFRILNLALHVASKIKEWHKAARSVNSAANYPAENEIKDWQRQISNAVDENEELLDQRDKWERRRKKSKSPRYPENENKPSQKWAYFKHVRQSYEYSQQALAQSDQHLAEQAERQRESTKKLDEIKIQLSSLDKEYKTMPAIIEILTKCLHNLTEFRTHLRHLKDFFDNLQLLVNESKNDANLFLETVKRGQSLPERSRKRAMERLLLRAISLRGHYAVTREISGVYVDVSRKHILPGVDLVERLGLTQPEGQTKDNAEKALELDEYATKALKEINFSAEKRRARLREKLFDQTRELEDVEQHIPTTE